MPTIFSKAVRQHGKLGLASVCEYGYTALLLKAERSRCILCHSTHIVIAAMVVSLRHRLDKHALRIDFVLFTDLFLLPPVFLVMHGHMMVLMVMIVMVDGLLFIGCSGFRSLLMLLLVIIAI